MTGTVDRVRTALMPFVAVLAMAYWVDPVAACQVTEPRLEAEPVSSTHMPRIVRTVPSSGGENVQAVVVALDDMAAV